MDYPSKPASKTVVHLPDWSEGNPYQLLLSGGLEKNGWDVRFQHYPDSPLPLQKVLNANPDAKALHLHWINPYIERAMWSKSFYPFYAKALLLSLDIWLARVRGRKVIWTVHNRVSHESKNPDHERIMRRLLARSVSHLIFHSAGARNAFRDEISPVSDARSAVIPHGNYIGVYQQDEAIQQQLAERFELTPAHTVVLFFGALRHYKGVPRLLKAFQQHQDANLRLIIAGQSFEDELTQQAENAAHKDSRIKLLLGFIPDQEVAPLFSLAHIVALPFEHTLTSGSALLAISLGKALLLPEHAKTLDVVDDRGAIFFSNDKHLEKTLLNLATHPLKQMGKFNLELAQQLSWENIGKGTAILYGV